MISSVGIARAGTSSRYLLGGGSGFVHLTYAPLCGHRKSPQSNRRYFTLFATPTEEQQPRIARVPGRAIYSLDGRDTIKFLQGLITNNVESLISNNPLYCAFLNPQGRMLSTAFIYLLNRESDQSASVLVDVDASVSANLLSFVKRFKLRSKVTIKDVSDEFQVWATWGKVPERNQSEIESNNVFVASGHDTRTPHMGRRMILKKEHQGGKDTADSAMMQLCQVDSVSSPESYTIHRILQGVADGANDVWENQSLPLEANVDYMNGIDYRKGCYVGQELTARTYHTGVVRKRIIPVSFYPASSPPPEALQVDLECSLSLPEKGADVRSIPIGDESARGKSAGKFLSGSNNIGLALLRLEQVHRWNEDLLIKVKTPGDDAQDLNIRPWIPSWWPEEGKKRPE